MYHWQSNILSKHYSLTTLQSQVELNDIIGNTFAQKNIEYPIIDLELIGNYRNFDIAPQEITPLTISSTDNMRGISFSSKSFYVNRMEWEYNPTQEMFRPRISLAEIATGFDGDTVSIPAAPNLESGGFNVPTIQVPQIIIPPYPVITMGVGIGGNFEWHPLEYGSSDAGGGTQYASVGFVAGFAGYMYTHIPIPNAELRTAYVYAIVQTQAATNYDYNLRVDRESVDAAVDTYFVDDDFQITNSWGVLTYQVVGPVIVLVPAGHMLFCTLQAKATNGDASSGYGFFISWV